MTMYLTCMSKEFDKDKDMSKEFGIAELIQCICMVLQKL